MSCGSTVFFPLVRFRVVTGHFLQQLTGNTKPAIFLEMIENTQVD